MNENSNAIITLCSHLCVGGDVLPLEPKEWSDFAKKLVDLNFKPSDVFGFSKDDLIKTFAFDDAFADRIIRLIDRNASLVFELEKLENTGIGVVTRADREYPAPLKKKLGNNCPPLFYYAGDLTVLGREAIGYVGSRSVNDNDLAFAARTVKKTVEKGYGVVSGGARGVDSASEEAAIEEGAFAVEYLSDSMARKLRLARVTKAIRDGKLLLVSVAKPDAGFNVGIAMMRNRFIYAQSQATVVVRSDLRKGGTWAGATENLKYGWCKTLCWDNKAYKGNQELIKEGAIAISDDFDGDPMPLTPSVKQISFID